MNSDSHNPAGGSAADPLQDELVREYDEWNGCFPGNMNVEYWMKRARDRLIEQQKRMAAARSDLATFATLARRMMDMHPGCGICMGKARPAPGKFCCECGWRNNEQH